MAKTQYLSLNPTKISGACGRLMCCLKYEQEAYEDVLKEHPQAGGYGWRPRTGVGTVNSGAAATGEKVKVRLDDDPENPGCTPTPISPSSAPGKGKRPGG